jgi:probable O-glycosylation ligase (exosortase A-associated)
LGAASIGFGIAIALADPLIVLGIVGATVMAALMFVMPYLGALVYLVFEYARLSMMFPFLQSLQIGKLIVIPTVLAWFVNWVIFKRTELVRDKVYYLMGFWLLLALVAAPFALNSTKAFESTFDLLKWFIVAFLLMNLLDNVTKWKIALWLLVLLNLKLSQHQIRGFVTGLGSASNRAFYIHDGVGGGSSFFGNATDFGLAMAIILPLTFYLIKTSKPLILKIMAAGASVGLTISVLYSGSRGAAVAMFAAAFVYWLQCRRKVITAVLVVGFIAAFWLGAPPEWKERFESAENYEEDGTAQQRFDLWEAGIRMMADYPLTGVGLSNYEVNFRTRYFPPGYQGAFVCHNILIQAGSELGFGGIGVVLALFSLAFIRNRQTRQLCAQIPGSDSEIVNYSRALDLALITYFVGGMFVTVLYYPHLYVLLGFTFALHNIAQKRVREDAQLSLQ